MDERRELELSKLIAERDIRRQLFAYQEAINRADYDGLARFFGDLSGDYSRHMRMSPREMAVEEGFFDQEQGAGPGPR